MLGKEINRIISEVAARGATRAVELPRSNGSMQTELGTRLDAMNPVLSQIVRTGNMVEADGTQHPVHSNIAPEEVLFLAKIVREAKPRVSLEIGLAYGTSALTILDSVDRRTHEKHICIDPYQNRQPDWGGRGLHNLERAGFSPFVEFHEARSYEVLPRLLAQGETVDFAFIDGWHTLDYVLVDFFFVDKLLRPGGTVVLDDADSPPIRKLLRYVLANLNYSVVRTLARPLSFRRRAGNAIGAAFSRLGRAARLQRLVNGLFRPEFLDPDEQLGLGSGCVALRKERNDRRRWDYHVEF
jgi:predicted O-methyltransferase YrrM